MLVAFCCLGVSYMYIYNYIIYVCVWFIHPYIYIWINRLDAGRIQIRLVACRSKLFWDPASRMEKYRAVLIWSFDGENLWWWKHVSQRGVCIIARVISVIIHGYIYSYYIYTCLWFMICIRDPFQYIIFIFGWLKFQCSPGAQRGRNPWVGLLVDRARWIAWKAPGCSWITLC